MDADQVRKLRQWAEKKAGFEAYAQLAAEWESQREALEGIKGKLLYAMNVKPREMRLADAWEVIDRAFFEADRALAVSSSTPTTPEEA
jgi:hypothetical protein